MNTIKQEGFKAELPGLPDLAESQVVINRRGLPVAAGRTEAEARAAALRVLQARRATATRDRAWRAERRNDPAWAWAFN